MMQIDERLEYLLLRYEEDASEDNLNDVLEYYLDNVVEDDIELLKRVRNFLIEKGGKSLLILTKNYYVTRNSEYYDEEDF